MSDKSVIDQLVAICDPLVLLDAIFADEEAYQKRGLENRLYFDINSLTIVTLASFVFDKLTQIPILTNDTDSREIFGYSLVEAFEGTVQKLRKADFILFDLESYVKAEDKDKLDRIINFLNQAVISDQKVNRLVDEISPLPSYNGLYNIFTFSRFTGLPVVASLHTLIHLHANNSPESQESITKFLVLQDILSVELPVLEVRNLDDILDIRSTYGAHEFRRLFAEFFMSLDINLAEIEEGDLLEISKKWQQTKNEITDLLIQEFREDINGWQLFTASSSVIMDIAGFIPGVSLLTGGAAMVKDTKELADKIAKRRRAHEFGSLCFLTDLRKRKHK